MSCMIRVEDNMKEKFTHMDYRNAKVIHIVEKEDCQRFIYKNEEICKEEADRITARYFEEKDKKKSGKLMQK